MTPEQPTAPAAAAALAPTPAPAPTPKERSLLPSWWTPRKVGTIVLGLATIASVPFINDRFASPEEALFKMGYKKNYSEFVQSIVNKHPDAASLFCKAGLRLKPGDVGLVFDERYYSADTVKALMKGGCMDSNHCPTALADMPVYLKSANHPDRRSDLRKLCGQPSVVRAIEANMEAERKVLSDNAAANSNRPARVKACAERYFAEGTDALMREASKFNLLGPLTYTPRQCVLAQLNIFLISGVPNGGSRDRAVFDAAAKCCSQEHAPMAVSQAQLEAAAQALNMLR